MAHVTAQPRTVDPAEAKAAVERAERELRELREILERAGQPRLPRPTTTVIRFQKRFTGSKVYQYAAIKADGNGYWYTTGNSGPSCFPTWELLSKFICEDNTLAPSYTELEPTSELPF